MCERLLILPNSLRFLQRCEGTVNAIAKVAKMNLVRPRSPVFIPMNINGELVNINGGYYMD